jgi:mono/diheme cytochrome c family protein
MPPLRLSLASTALILSATAAAAPYADADLATGEQLHAKLCVQCHETRFGGEDGAAVYLRPDRRVQSASALTQQITTCTTMLNLDLFPEDEQHLAGYLNKHFYKFK